MSDGRMFESNELDDKFSLLLINVPGEWAFALIVADGDGGDSVINVGDSTCGPIRLSTVFGGGRGGTFRFTSKCAIDTVGILSSVLVLRLATSGVDGIDLAGDSSTAIANVSSVTAAALIVIGVDSFTSITVTKLDGVVLAVTILFLSTPFST